MQKIGVVIILVCLSMWFAAGCEIAIFPSGKYTYDPDELPSFPNTSIIPKNYPLFTQCDPLWGANFMGGDSYPVDTVCQQGCAMSSVSMALNGKGYFLDSFLPIYPGTMNAWLRYDNGYVCMDGDCNNLVLDSPNRLSPGNITYISEDEKPSLEVVKSYILNQNPISVAHVRNDTHFVLLVGFDSVNETTFYVNDPYYPVISYDFSEISDIILYNMTQQAPLPPPKSFKKYLQY